MCSGASTRLCQILWRSWRTLDAAKTTPQKTVFSEFFTKRVVHKRGSLRPQAVTQSGWVESAMTG
eukprot:scaffold7629_cov36-Tisochrysis_lutea.AAC.3